MERIRIQDACRGTLMTAYDMMTEYGWTEYKAYSYAEDLLQGMLLGLMAVRAYDEMTIVRYYREIAWNRLHKAWNR